MDALKSRAEAVLRRLDEARADAMLRRLDGDHGLAARSPRPFMVELFGTPKAGKSTVLQMLKHFFRRLNGWKVSTPTEGAEVVEWPRDEPQYNFQTCEYALSEARDRVFSDFHVAIFDRAMFDGVVRMEHYARKGIITRPQQEIIEEYYLLPWNRDMFDRHVGLVSSPEVAIERELARALTKRHGKTMNPDTLRELYAAHEAVWDRFAGSGIPLTWHDSSEETEEQTARSILSQVLTAFERRRI